MTWQVGVTFATLAGVIAGMVWTKVGPDMVLLGGLAVLVICGVATPGDALSGFANEGVATIAALFVVAEGVRRTGGLNFIGNSLLGEPRHLASAQLRMMAPVAALSAVLNNTPVVATMMPIVTDWARRQRISLSHLLLPLSYASMLGGLLTLVGTSTTLVVNGLLLETAGQRGLSMFEMAWVGLPITVVGLAYIPLASRWLLPPRKPAISQFADAREYVLEMLVEVDSPVVGQSIADAGLRSLPGMYLMEIQRGHEVLAAVGPGTVVHARDRLVFVGIVASVVDLQKIPGLTPAADQLYKIDKPRSHRCLIEAVVSGSSRLVGVSIRAAKFRTQYNAVVIAVARDGERVRKKIGDIELRAGDTLLLESHPSFADAQRNSRDFLLVSRVQDSTPVQHQHAWAARLILAAMVLLVTVEALSMLRAACLAGCCMVLTRCLRISQAKRAIDWGVLLGIGSGLGLGVALQRCGGADILASGLLKLIGSSPMLALVLVYALTGVLANIITTKAAAVLVFPVALAVANHLGVNFMPFAVCLTVAAASAYATPVGYQTNLMVYGPGGYRGVDFLRVGGPLSLLVGLITILIVPLVWPL